MRDKFLLRGVLKKHQITIQTILSLPMADLNTQPNSDSDGEVVFQPGGQPSSSSFSSTDLASIRILLSDLSD